MRLKSISFDDHDEAQVLLELRDGAALPAALESVCRRYRLRPMKLHAVGISTALQPAELPQLCPSSLIFNQYPAQSARLLVEILGIIPKDKNGPEIRCLPAVDGASRALIDYGGRRRFIASGITASGGDFSAQAEGCFQRIEQCLEQQGLVPADIYRTWFFVDDIRRNYAELNRVRNRYFDRWSIADFPASTGVGARLPGRARLLVNFEAADVRQAAGVVAVPSSYQCAPAEYGVRFNRANRLQTGRRFQLNISGISSIDRSGESVRCETIDRHLEYSMQCFADLLARGGMNLADLLSCSLYFKNAAVEQRFRRLHRRRGWSFGYLYNYCDICRPDLLFEVEGQAVRAARTDQEGEGCGRC